ncbi:MAG: glycosyltransferase family 39 protein [Candidatus Goldbacteria bacterium]|nr:glycosyltransferase family 39 protein [Candidatus Goldiibacteriota bacterium]
MKKEHKKNYSKNNLLLPSFFVFIGIVLFFYSWYVVNPFKSQIGVIFLIISLFCILYFFYKYNKYYVDEFYIFKYRKMSFKKSIFFFSLSILISLLAFFLFWHKKWIILSFILFIIFIFCLTKIVKIKEVIHKKDKKLKINIKKIKLRILLLIKAVILLLLSFLIQKMLLSGLVPQAFLSIVFLSIIIGDFYNTYNFNEEDKNKKFTIEEKVFLFLIISAAIFLRFYKIEEIPPGFDNDARTKFNYITDIIMKGKPLELFVTYGGSAYGVLDYYITYFFLKLFGFNLLNMRIIAILFSLFSLFFFFMLVKELYGKSVAIIALMFFSILFICISFSRNDEFVYRVVFYFNAGAYFLIRGIKTGKWIFFILAAIFMGFNIFAYQAGKMHIPLIIIIFCLYTFNFSKIQIFLKNLFPLIIVFIIAFVMISPLIAEIIQKLDNYFGFYREFKLKSNRFTILTDLFKQFIIVAKSFTVKGTEHFTTVLPGRPILIGLEQIFFILGVVYILYNFKCRANIIVISWFLLGIFPIIYFPYVFELYYYRMILVFPVLTIVMALGFHVIYTHISEYFKNKKIVYTLLFLISFIFSFQNSYVDYFKKFPINSRVRDRYHHVNFEIEKEIKRASKNSTIFLSEYFIKDIYSLFFAQDARNKNGQPLFTTLDISRLKISDFFNSEKDIVIIGEGFYADYFDYLKEFFPNIRIETKENIYNEKMLVDPFAAKWLYVVITIPIRDIKNAYGLNIKIYKKNKCIKEQFYPKEKNIEDGDSYIISGIIELPENTNYFFDAGDNIKLKTIINNKIYKNEKLPSGLHEIKFIINGNINSIPDLFWTYKNKREIIPEKFILKAKSIFGIQVNYQCNNKEYLFSNIEPTMLMRMYWFYPRIQCNDKNNHYKIICTGYYFADIEGDYYFELESYDKFKNEIYINKNICFFSLNNKKDILPIKLQKGWNNIIIISDSFFDKPDAAAFYYRLKVKKPGYKDSELVKYNELKPYKPNI